MLSARPEQPHALGTATRQPAGTVDGRRIIMVLGIWIAISAVSGTATFLGIQTFGSSWKATDGATVVVVAEVYFVLLATMFVAFGGRSGLRDRLSFRFTSFGDVALGLGVWALMLAVNALLYAALSPIFGSFQTTAVQILRLVSDMSRLPGADPVSLFFIVIRACLVVPLTEELVFRGMLFGWLRQRAPAAPTILVSAAIFAVYHFYPLVMPLALLWGIGAAWVREHTGSSLNFLVPHVATSVLFLAVGYALNSQV